MQLSVTGHHVDVTPAMRNYVASKLEKVERHFDLVSDVHCILTVEKLRHKAEATINVNGGKFTPMRLKKTCTRQLMAWSTSWIDRFENTRKSWSTTMPGMRINAHLASRHLQLAICANSE